LSGPCIGDGTKEDVVFRVIETTTLNVYSSHLYAWLEFANQVLQLNRWCQQGWFSLDLKDCFFIFLASQLIKPPKWVADAEVICFV